MDFGLGFPFIRSLVLCVSVTRYQCGAYPSYSKLTNEFFSLILSVFASVSFPPSAIIDVSKFCTEAIKRKDRERIIGQQVFHFHPPRISGKELYHKNKRRRNAFSSSFPSPIASVKQNHQETTVDPAQQK